MERGGVLKATVEEGTGNASPNVGDLVLLKYTVFEDNDTILESTFHDVGGIGVPLPYILGAGNPSFRPLRGVELALLEMKQQEFCRLQIKPELAYMHKLCKAKPPKGLRKDQTVNIDVFLAAFYGNTRCLSSGVFLHTLQEGSGWETPRAPFQVKVSIILRNVSSDGLQRGPPIVVNDTPIMPGPTATIIECCLGDGTLFPGVEAALNDMHKGEEAVVLMPCTMTLGLPCAAHHHHDVLHYIEAVVRLIDFFQVRDVTGDGGSMKRTIRKGKGEFPADCPLEDTSVRAVVKVRNVDGGRWVDLTNASNGTVEFETGMGVVPFPVEASIRVMLRGEVARVTTDWAHVQSHASSDTTTTTTATTTLPLPDTLSRESDIEFEITLLDFDPVLHLAEASVDDKLQQAVGWKEQGNRLFKQCKYALARKKYMKAIRAVDQVMGFDTEEQVTLATVTKISSFTNLAACALRDEEWGEVIQWCNKAIRYVCMYVCFCVGLFYDNH